MSVALLEMPAHHPERGARSKRRLRALHDLVLGRSAVLGANPGLRRVVGHVVTNELSGLFLGDRRAERGKRVAEGGETVCVELLDRGEFADRGRRLCRGRFAYRGRLAGRRCSLQPIEARISGIAKTLSVGFGRRLEKLLAARAEVVGRFQIGSGFVGGDQIVDAFRKHIHRCRVESHRCSRCGSHRWNDRWNDRWNGRRRGVRR